eukprot:5639293-Prymnesium_polylepis.1
MADAAKDDAFACVPGDDRDKDAVRPYLPHGLAAALDEPEDGPYSDNAAFLRDLEALSTLQVAVYKLSLEVGHRVLSHASDDFAHGGADSVQRAVAAGPALAVWVGRLQARVDTRSCLPLPGNNLPPRFHRVCQIYQLDAVDRRLLGALLMQRISHAFTSVKLGGQMGYGGGGGVYGNQTKSGVTLATILGVELLQLSHFQKPERRHVKQGIVLPAAQARTRHPGPARVRGPSVSRSHLAVHWPPGTAAGSIAPVRVCAPPARPLAAHRPAMHPHAQANAKSLRLRARQVLSEVPALQPEAVLLMVGLALN